MRKYPRKFYSQAQRAWCERYERETTFEPLMCDYEAGNETFVEAARKSAAWFESWASDAYQRGCDDIPGAMEAMLAEVLGSDAQGERRATGEAPQ